MVGQRPSWDDYYLGIAREVAKRGTCLRRRFGAVIVNRGQITSTGYVGAPRGTINCCDIGVCFRDKLGVPPGERYELCRSVHAEANAIIHASRESMLGGTLYLYGENIQDEGLVANLKPCKMCARMIINAGIKEVVVAAREGTMKFSVEDLVKGDAALLAANNREDVKGY